MKKLLNIYRCIVGQEFGWSGEGNVQWYYFLALVINCMLTWWLKPELGLIFTVAAIVHYTSVAVYGYNMLELDGIKYAIGYYAIHLVIIITCLIIDWKWTILTAFIVIVAYLFAPDETGNNIFMRPAREFVVYYGNDNYYGILSFHTIMFFAFFIVTFMLPISIWIKILIILGCMVLHPIIDFFEGECVIIKDVTHDSLEVIIEYMEERTNSGVIN